MLIDGCSALVTGGASGLGNATARALTDAGARVVLLDLPSSQGEKAATALGPTARFVPGDVTDGDQVQAAGPTAPRSPTPSPGRSARSSTARVGSPWCCSARAARREKWTRR